MSTEPDDTSTIRIRVRWAALAVPAFTIGWAFAQTMGEVVGEAWGGDFLHLLGHAIGTVVLVGLLSIAGWIALRGRQEWVSWWAAAAIVGSIVGLALYTPILALAPDAVPGLTIAGTLHLPLLMSATVQVSALRGQPPGPRRWPLTWLVGVVLGVAGWFAGGGYDAIEIDSVHPVLDKALTYWWRAIPTSLLGAMIFAVWTARAIPLHTAPRSRLTERR